MVTKKYLCNAPRQEVWDEKVDAMLKSLRGTEKQKRKYIRKTLQGLQEEHGHEKRSGPGRKSNAFYALTYFEYALSKVGGSLDDDSSSAASSEEEESEEEDLKSAKGKSQKSQETEEEKTIESMDSQEFLNEHNDLCDVCNEGGELLCCSTCNLVFHLGCLRPAMEELPQHDWSCPYCVLSGTPVANAEKEEKQSVKRNSKMWKAAAVGVRQMGRLRALSDNKDDPDAAGKDEADPADDDKDGTETPAKKGATEDSDAKTPPDLTTPPLRGKRARRQVTLYDPQEGPASEWKSDENYGIEKEEPRTNPELEPMARKRRRMARKKQEEGEEGGEESSQDADNEDGSTSSAFCKFCNDDKEIPLCVFCGCRVCFGKKDKQKLLICDGCDEEYHIYCLDPPLTSAPKASASWYCPSCANEKTTPRVHKTRRASVATPKAAAAASPPVTTPKSSSKPASKPTSTGRPRGRPPKNATAVAAPASTPTTTPTPKRRGRPPKSATKAAQAAPPVETPVPRKRGRPPKNASTTPSSDSSKRKQSPSSSAVSGSSSKKARTTAPPAPSPISVARKVTTLPSVVAATDNVSRSGRVLKATSKQQARAEQQAQTKVGTEAPKATTRATSSGTKVSEVSATKKTAPSAAASTTPHQSPTKTKQTVSSSPKKSAPGPATTQSTAETPNSSAATAAATPKLQTIPPTNASPAAPQTTTKPPALPVQPGHPASTPKPPVATGTTPPASLQSAKVAATAPSPSTASGSVPPTVTNATPAATTTATGASKSSATAPVAKKPSTAPAITSKLPTISVTTREPQGKLEIPVAPIVAAVKKVAAANPRAKLDVPSLVAKAIRQSAAAARADVEEEEKPSATPAKAPRRKPGARECMQISRRFGLRVIPQKYMETLLDYCTRGKVEHLIRMRERLDEHSRFLEAQLAGLEAVIREVGESDVVVPALPDRPDNKPHNSAPASR